MTYLVRRKTLCFELATIELEAESQAEALRLACEGYGDEGIEDYDYDIGIDPQPNPTFELAKGYEDSLYPQLVINADKFFLVRNQNDLRGAANKFEVNQYEFTQDFANRSSDYLFIDPSSALTERLKSTFTL